MRLTILAFLAIFCLFSCSSETTEGSFQVPNGATIGEDGFFYQIHKDAEGETPKVGEVAVFSLTQRFDDTTLYQSADRGKSERVALPDMTKGPQKPSPVISLLMKMSIGDSGSVYIPVDSLGDKVEAWQKEKKFLIYDMKMENFFNPKLKENAVATQVAETLAAYKAGTLKDIKTTKEGLKYVLHEEGKGEKAAIGTVVSVDYFGVLATDGTMFDNSFGRGEAYRFPLGGGRVIKGWDVGIAKLTKGSKATLFIPSDLGYGAAGSPPTIPGGAELVFYVELQE